MKYNKNNFELSEEYTLKNEDIKRIKDATIKLSLIDSVRCVVMDAHPHYFNTLFEKYLSCSVYLYVLVSDYDSIFEVKKILNGFKYASSANSENSFDYGIVDPAMLRDNASARALFMRNISDGYTLIDRDNYFDSYQSDRVSKCHLLIKNIDQLERKLELTK